MKNKSYNKQAGEQQKSRKRPRSFVLKITFNQIVRMLFVMLLIDVVVIGFYLGAYLLRSEEIAVQLSEMPVEEALSQTTAITPEITAYLYNGEPQGQKFKWYGPVKIDTPEGTVRDWSINSGKNYFSRDWWVEGAYTVYLPKNAGEQYLAVEFDLAPGLYRLRNFCGFLLGIQGLILFFSMFSIRKSVRKTLAPIHQLTMATKSFSAEPQQVKPQPELELSGTIHALNSITAKKLDTRISIDGEQAELKGLTGAINSMLERLDAAYQSQLRFVSDASHELRTPIAVIQGYANLLDRWGKTNPETLQESIDAIKAETSGMQALVEQLLFLARSDNNSIVLNLDTFDIAGLASEVVRDTQIIDQSHQLVADIDMGLWVVGDTGLLKQTLRIFMDNAIKYTPAGERIKISAKREDGQIRVSVSDNGIGIPEEDLPYVFERFYRSDESRARKTGGTGLGLSIAKWTVQRHGGYMEILSRKDIGTKLTMNLPAAQAKEEPLPEAL